MILGPKPPPMNGAIDPNLRLGESRASRRGRYGSGSAPGWCPRPSAGPSAHPSAPRTPRFSIAAETPRSYVKAPREDEVGGGTCRVVVALRPGTACAARLASEVLVDDRSSLGEGGPDVGHGVQRLADRRSHRRPRPRPRSGSRPRRRRSARRRAAPSPGRAAPGSARGRSDPRSGPEGRAAARVASTRRGPPP